MSCTGGSDWIGEESEMILDWMTAGWSDFLADEWHDNLTRVYTKNPASSPFFLSFSETSSAISTFRTESKKKSRILFSLVHTLFRAPFFFFRSPKMANITEAAIKTTEFLYANTDFTALNYAERFWAQWYLSFKDPSIATGLMSFLLHEIVYFGRCLPWIIIDAIPYFRRWKLQPGKIPSPAEQWECTKLVLFSHFTIELPQVCLPFYH